jgi:hypothetical protein
VTDAKAIDIDDAAVLAALDTIPDAVLAHLKPESLVTANNVAAEAGQRIARRTGDTAEGITVEETYNGEGYVVLVRGTRQHIARYLEFSTSRMTARPFLFPSAQLEQGPAIRRARVAVQDAIDEKGLGAD